MIPGSQYSKAWGKHRIFVELNSSTPASIDSKLDLPSRIMQQWFGVSANAVLNTRWSQINYKIIYPNVMDCANVTKITAPSSAKRYFPPPPWRACAVQRQFCFREWRASRYKQIANLASRRIGSLVMVAFSTALRMWPNRNTNIDLNIL